MAARNGSGRAAPSSIRRPWTHSASSSSGSSTARRADRGRAWPSSAAAPRASPPRTACCSCSPTTRAAGVASARCRGGHREGQDLRRPQPVGRRHAARVRSQELFPDLTREQWREQGFAFGEVHEGGRLPAAHGQARSRSRPRRRSRTTATRSSPSPPGPLPAGAGRGGRRVRPHRDGGHAAARRGRSGARRPHGRQGPRQGRAAAGQLRAGHGRRRRRRRCCRGLLGPPHRRGDQGVRPRRGPRAAGLGARVKEVWKVPSRSTASSTRSARGR
jgi:hypothetical protein